MRSRRTAMLVEAALTIALAAVLAQLRLWRMPMGGTVSLEMLPLVVYALRRGALPGVAAAALYGVVNYLFDPVGVVHWAQYLLDYPVAHGLVGLAGLFAPLWRRTFAEGAARGIGVAVLPGVLVGALARFAAHWVSGFVYFASYAPEGQPAWLYSLLYNGTYMLPAAVACAVGAAAVMPVLQRRVPVS